MSAQDLEQRARELLPELPPMAMTIAGNAPDAGHWYRAEQMRDYATSAIAAALRQQPAPAIIDNAGKVEVLARGWFHRLPDGDYVFNDEAWRAGKDCDGCIPCLIVASAAPHQPAPVVDDARMARALEWVRVMAMQDADGSHVPAIQEAIAAYDPNCGARTVRVAERLDEYLEKEHGVRIGRQAAIAALTAARAQGVQS